MSTAACVTPSSSRFNALTIFKPTFSRNLQKSETVSEISRVQNNSKSYWLHIQKIQQQIPAELESMKRLTKSPNKRNCLTWIIKRRNHCKINFDCQLHLLKESLIFYALDSKTLKLLHFACEVCSLSTRLFLRSVFKVQGQLLSNFFWWKEFWYPRTPPIYKRGGNAWAILAIKEAEFTGFNFMRCLRAVYLWSCVNASNPAFDATSLLKAWKKPSKSSDGMLLTSTGKNYKSKISILDDNKRKLITVQLYWLYNLLSV